MTTTLLHIQECYRNARATLAERQLAARYVPLKFAAHYGIPLMGLRSLPAVPNSRRADEQMARSETSRCHSSSSAPPPLPCRS